jgi:hypothetical protein
MTYTGELTVTSCWCGVRLAIPSSLYREAKDNGMKVYCPLGHAFVFTTTEVERLRDQLNTERRRADHAMTSAIAARDQARATERSNIAYRGHLTRLRNRIANGVCPVKDCHRHFDNVQAHIASQHPEWAATHPDALISVN